VEVDGALAPEVMTELRSLKQVVRVDQLHFSQA
jgi:hypothetical protein